MVPYIASLTNTYNLPTLLSIENFKLVIDVPDGIISTIIVVSQYASLQYKCTKNSNANEMYVPIGCATERHQEYSHDCDCLFIHLSNEFMGIDNHLVIDEIGLDNLGLDVKVTKQLFPCSLLAQTDEVSVQLYAAFLYNINTFK
jgi:hypothetical protein